MKHTCGTLTPLKPVDPDVESLGLPGYPVRTGNQVFGRFQSELI